MKNLRSRPSKQFAIYFDYTGAGRGPEPVAGPFDTREQAAEYAKEFDMEGDDYFIDIAVDPFL